MNIVLLQGQLTLQEIDQLFKEFPQYLFLSLNEAAFRNFSPEHWSRLEILFGSRLRKEELAEAHQLRWIHCPTPQLNRLCLEEIEKQGNILITYTPDENIPQIGEFAIAGILAFAKNLFQWYEADKFPSLLWDSKWRDSMWTLKDKCLLQIGLGKVGTEIARRAQGLDMKVWGMQQHVSFHPYCHKIFSVKELHSILPVVDVVSLSLSRSKEFHHWLKKEELELMKEDSILILMGPSSWLDEQALAEVAESGKFRGIVIDSSYQLPISLQSVLWKVPNLLITPEVAPRPKSTERQAFRAFLYNLRQYVHGNFKDMKNMIDKKERIAL
jgi:phosphoglycerate dehydrogenase-like enzyme